MLVPSEIIQLLEANTEMHGPHSMQKDTLKKESARDSCIAAILHTQRLKGKLLGNKAVQSKLRKCTCGMAQAMGKITAL